jgi:hypothetical protein
LDSWLVICRQTEHRRAVKFVDLAAKHAQHSPAFSGERVLFARSRPGGGADPSLEPAPPLHPIQKRIDRTRAHLVAVPPELADHPLTQDGLRPGVMKDVNFPEGEQNLPLDLFLYGVITIIVVGYRVNGYDPRTRHAPCCGAHASG